MKKNVIAGVMLATAAIFGTSSAFAQAPQNNSCKPECKKENCKKENCKKENCNEGKKCHQTIVNPFEGLNLTAEQQAKLDALKAECKVEKDKVKKEASEKKDQVKQAAKAERTKMKTEMLAKVKAILTPEQYVQFLENAFINNGGPMGPQKQGMRPGKDHKGHKGGDKDHKGQRPEKNKK